MKRSSPGEGHRLRGRAAGHRRQGGKVQTNRPSLCPADELAEVRFSEVDTGPCEQHRGLGRIHRQVVDPDLEQSTLRTEEGGGQRQRIPRADRQL